MHSITAKLNNSARTHVSDKGTTFFISLGERNYNYKTKQTEWTNYEAALFAKDAQVNFYEGILVAGAVVAVSAKGILVQQDEQYGPKLILNDASLDFAVNEHKAAVEQAKGMSNANQQLQNNPARHASGGLDQTNPTSQHTEIMDDFDDPLPF